MAKTPVREGSTPPPSHSHRAEPGAGSRTHFRGTSVPLKSHESTTRVHAVHTQQWHATSTKRENSRHGRNIRASRSAVPRAVLGVPSAPAGLRWHATRLRQVPCGRHRLPGLCRQEAVDLAGSWPSHVPSPEGREEEGPSQDQQQQDTTAPSRTTITRHTCNPPQRLHLGRP